jgi:hypothetical protein
MKTLSLLLSLMLALPAYPCTRVLSDKTGDNSVIEYIDGKA